MTDEWTPFLIWVAIAIAFLAFMRCEFLMGRVDVVSKQAVVLCDQLIEFQIQLNSQGEAIKQLAAATNMTAQALYNDIEELDRRARNRQPSASSQVPMGTVEPTPTQG